MKNAFKIKTHQNHSLRDMRLQHRNINIDLYGIEIGI